MKKTLVILITMLLTVSCGKKLNSIERGSFTYLLKINGMTAGKSVITRKMENGNHITETAMTMKAGHIENSALVKVTETSEFKPVKLEIINTMKDTSSNAVQEIKKTALFNDNTVSLDTNGYKSEFKIDENFYLDGDFFIDELKKKKFKPGTVVRAKIYEPTVKVDSPILVIYKVIGDKKISLNNREIDTVHISQKIEMLKSIDWYISRDGVVQKVVIKMLNNIIEMELVN